MRWRRWASLEYIFWMMWFVGTAIVAIFLIALPAIMPTQIGDFVSHLAERLYAAGDNVYNHAHSASCGAKRNGGATRRPDCDAEFRASSPECLEPSPQIAKGPIASSAFHPVQSRSYSDSELRCGGQPFGDSHLHATWCL